MSLASYFHDWTKVISAHSVHGNDDENYLPQTTDHSYNFRGHNDIFGHSILIIKLTILSYVKWFVYVVTGWWVGACRVRARAGDAFHRRQYAHAHPIYKPQPPIHPLAVCARTLQCPLLVQGLIVLSWIHGV